MGLRCSGSINRKGLCRPGNKPSETVKLGSVFKKSRRSPGSVSGASSVAWGWVANGESRLSGIPLFYFFVCMVIPSLGATALSPAILMVLIAASSHCVFPWPRGLTEDADMRE